jgi:hypothetical protein
MEVATKTKVSMTGIANNVYTSAGDASTFSEHEQMPENHFFHAKSHCLIRATKLQDWHLET